MLTDPQSVTISGTARTLPRLEERPDTNVYSDRANGVDLFVTQRVDKKGTYRPSISLVTNDIVTDPISGLKSRVPTSITINGAIPVGKTVADVEALYVAMNAALSAGTNALLRKVLGGER